MPQNTGKSFVFSIKVAGKTFRELFKTAKDVMCVCKTWK